MAKSKNKINIVAGDLPKILSEKRRELQSLAFKGAGSKVANVRQGRQLRKDIARALTAANNPSNIRAKN